MFRKLIGVLLLLIGVIGVGLSIAGIYFSDQIVSAFGGGLDSTLQLTADSLVTVEDTLGWADIYVQHLKEAMTDNGF